MTVKEIKGFTCLGIKLWKVDDMFLKEMGYEFSEVFPKTSAGKEYIDFPFKAIKKETEKAVLLSITRSTFAKGREGEVEYWIPKSAIEGIEG